MLSPLGVSRVQLHPIASSIHGVIRVRPKFCHAFQTNRLVNPSWKPVCSYCTQARSSALQVDWKIEKKLRFHAKNLSTQTNPLSPKVVRGFGLTIHSTWGYPHNSCTVYVEYLYESLRIHCSIIGMHNYNCIDVYIYIYSMYNNRMYINIMFMYIYYAQHIHMYVHHLRCKDHRCSAKPPKTLFCSHEKRCHWKRSKLAVWEASAREVGDGLRYRLLRKGYQQTGKEQQYLQYPKRDPKKDVSLWLHNTACLVMFVASIILRLPFIDPETNRRKKQMKKKSKKKVFVTPLKINMEPNNSPFLGSSCLFSRVHSSFH